jgi:flagellar biosynthesis GTPase FlhF
MMNVNNPGPMNVNNPGPCANPACQLGGIAPSTHTCPDCEKNVHVLCGRECENMHNVLCEACFKKRTTREVWCASCKARGRDAKEPSFLCSDCKKEKQQPRHRHQHQEQQEEQLHEERELQEEEEQKEQEEQEEQEQSAPKQKRRRKQSAPKRKRRRKKRELPPRSDELKETSLWPKLSQPDSIMDYHDYLAEFMSFRDGKDYQSPHPFPNMELTKITPQEVTEFLAMKAYGKQNPGPEDHPTVGRASSLEYYKKALSYFMPNRLMGWNYQVGWGNPTRSSDVNQLINAVKKKEAKGLGKASQARRDFDKEEFDQIMAHLGEQSDIDHKLGIPCLFKFAYHLIARLDDSCKLRRKKLQQNARIPGTLRVKLQWTKNARTEKECPWQIIFGAKDTGYCLILALALHLETAISRHGNNKEFIFHFGKANPQTANSYVGTALRNILKADIVDLISGEDGKLGTHSNRKYGTTAARRRGANKDFVDFRARWKQLAKQQDRYANADLPWPDGDVAAKLCVGGPIRYQVKPKSGITTGFILEMWSRTLPPMDITVMWPEFLEQPCFGRRLTMKQKK